MGKLSHVRNHGHTLPPIARARSRDCVHRCLRVRAGVHALAYAGCRAADADPGVTDGHGAALHTYHLAVDRNSNPRTIDPHRAIGYCHQPGPDRVALLALLRSTPLTDEQITEVVDSIDEEELSNGVDRDVIADFISDMTHYDAGPENIARVAARLAAAGWPLTGINDQAGATVTSQS